MKDKHWTNINIDYVIFKDLDGNEINHRDYEKMLIKGDSLDICHIHDEDLVFIKKLTHHEYSETVDLPKCFIFHDKEQEFIARYVWKKFNIFEDNWNDVFKSIVESEPFNKKIRSDIRYVNDEFMYHSLRIPKNVSNISIVTKLNEDNKFIFDWVDSCEIFGEIKHSYTI